MSAAPVVEARGLRKSYRDRSRSRLRGTARPALAGLDLVVSPGAGGGTVHGFLGPNGSGKTTTLRVLLGLVSRDAGEVTVLGQPVPGGLSAAVAGIGALIEGRNSSRSSAATGTCGCLPRARRTRDAGPVAA